MTERVRVGDIDLTYQTLGRPEDPPVLLVMGLGAQLHYWPDGFCQALVERGLFVVRYDNRDTGTSTHLHEAGPVDLAALLASGAPPPYGLSDLAADAVGLVDALGLAPAHLVGVSLGGMIVQVAAIEHPALVRSMVSISSTTGDRAVGGSRPEVLQALLTRAGTTRDEVIESALAVSRLIGSPGFEQDEDWLRWRTGAAFDRDYDPSGVSRHAAAAFAAEDRTQRLAMLRLPALVVHGSADALVDVSGGRATAAAIPDAELLVIDGLGHDLPRQVWPVIADAIARTVRRAQATEA